MLVDLAHKSFHEDDFREADREVSKVAGKGVHVVEVVQLHGIREIQRQVLQIGTLVGQLMEDDRSDEFSRQFDVSKRISESNADQSDQRVDVVNIESGEVRSEGDASPEATVVGQETPLLADLSQPTKVVQLEVGKYLQQELVRQMVNALLIG